MLINTQYFTTNANGEAVVHPYTANVYREYRSIEMNKYNEVELNALMKAGWRVEHATIDRLFLYRFLVEVPTGVPALTEAERNSLILIATQSGA